MDGYTFWTFSDIFEEHYFPAAPFHGGFGLLKLNGVAKPSYRAFQSFTGSAPSSWRSMERSPTSRYG